MRSEIFERETPDERARNFRFQLIRKKGAENSCLFAADLNS